MSEKKIFGTRRDKRRPPEPPQGLVGNRGFPLPDSPPRTEGSRREKQPSHHSLYMVDNQGCRKAVSTRCWPLTHVACGELAGMRWDQKVSLYFSLSLSPELIALGLEPLFPIHQPSFPLPPPMMPPVNAKSLTDDAAGGADARVAFRTRRADYATTLRKLASLPLQSLPILTLF